MDEIHLAVLVIFLLAAFATSAFMRREARTRDAGDAEQDARLFRELDEIEREAERRKE